MNVLVRIMLTIMLLVGGLLIFLKLTYCTRPPATGKQAEFQRRRDIAEKEMTDDTDPFAGIKMICKEDAAGGLCFCCHAPNGYCATGAGASFPQMTCDQANQMNFDIIWKGQRRQRR